MIQCLIHHYRPNRVIQFNTGLQAFYEGYDRTVTSVGTAQKVCHMQHSSDI